MKIKRSRVLRSSAIVAGVLGAIVRCGSSTSSTPTYNYAGSGSEWSWTLSSDGTFSASESVSSVTASGTYSRLSSGFVKMTVTASTGTNAPTVGSNAYGLEVPGVAFLVKPVLSSESQIITMVAKGTCPSADFTANWILTQFGSGSDISSASQDVFGTFQWTNASSTPSLPTRYAVQGYTSVGAGTISGGTCSSGVMTITEGKMFLTSQGGALVKLTDNGSGSGGVFAMPQKTISAGTALTGDYAGLLFNNQETGTNKVKPVKATVNAAGTSITVTGVSDPEAGTVDSTLSGTVSIDTVDSPSIGFIKATVTANSSTGKMACMADTNAVSTSKKIIFCVGQSPGDNTKPFNILLVSK